MKTHHSKWLAVSLAILTVLALAACTPQPTQQQTTSWQVIPENSAIYLVTTKKQHIAEVMQIPGLTGQYRAGKLQLEIDLSSIDSGVPIRDQRMREHLFDVASAPSARLTAALPAAMLQPGRHTVGFTLEMRGASHDYTADIWVSALNNDRLLVSLVKPIVVQAKDFGLVDGVDTLADLVNLAHISYAVPVTASLVLQPAD